jgi:hypothetical protein
MALVRLARSRPSRTSPSSIACTVIAGTWPDMAQEAQAKARTGKPAAHDARRMAACISFEDKRMPSTVINQDRQARPTCRAGQQQALRP